MRKLALIFIPLLLILSLASTFHFLFFDFDLDIEVFPFLSWGLFGCFTIGAMFRLGTFRKSKWMRGAYFGIAALCLGILFKLQHLPGGNLIFMLGLLLIAIFYVTHSITRQKKRFVDRLNVLCVVVMAVGMLLKASQTEHAALISWIVFAAAMVLVVVFYISLLKPEPVA